MSGMGKALKSIVGTIVVAGVVLGLFRVLGKGAGLTDPAFWANAQASIQEFMAFSQRVAQRILH